MPKELRALLQRELRPDELRRLRRRRPPRPRRPLVADRAAPAVAEVEAVDRRHAAAARGAQGQPARTSSRCCAHGDVLVQHPYDSLLDLGRGVRAPGRRRPRRARDQADAVPHVRRGEPDRPARSSAPPRSGQAGRRARRADRRAATRRRTSAGRGRLEKAGVHVVYGVVGLKTHAKTVLVVRRRGRASSAATATSAPATTTRSPRASTRTSGCSRPTPSSTADVADLFNYLTGYSNQQRLPEGARRARRAARRAARADPRGGARRRTAGSSSR